MKTVFITLLILFAGSVSAEDQRFPFSNPEQVEQFRKLTEELRCLVCQNQSLADSHAPLANDLRQRIYAMIDAGKTNDEILEELVTRYGEFVLYRPRLTPKTYLLWFAPVLLLFTGVMAVIMIIRRRSNFEGVQDTDLQNVRKLLEDDE